MVVQGPLVDGGVEDWVGALLTPLGTATAQWLRSVGGPMTVG